jgi:hypothetical protein
MLARRTYQGNVNVRFSKWEVITTLTEAHLFDWSITIFQCYPRAWWIDESQRPAVNPGPACAEIAFSSTSGLPDPVPGPVLGCICCHLHPEWFTTATPSVGDLQNLSRIAAGRSRPRAQRGSIFCHPVACVTHWLHPISNLRSLNLKTGYFTPLVHGFLATGWASQAPGFPRLVIGCLGVLFISPVPLSYIRRK